MIKAGVIGAGHLGSIHLKLLKESNFFELIGFFDTNTKISNINDEFLFFDNIDKLINSIDAAFICTNTPNHYKIAKKCIENSKHVFIEKPITNDVDQAIDLVTLSNKKKIKGQVGHVERFNSAFTCLNDTINNPKFIECHRLAEFNPRGNDVSVVLDLMIHDIDIVLSLVKSKPNLVNANGVSVINEAPDICNARVEFENGCVANFTASDAISGQSTVKLDNGSAAATTSMFKLVRGANDPENKDYTAINSNVIVNIARASNLYN